MKDKTSVVKITRSSLTDAEIVGLYIQAVNSFAQVSSEAGLTKGQVFELGERLFDEAIASISTTRRKLSDVSRPDGE
jgi:hypothetical protein